jgi:hypothetical protein
MALTMYGKYSATFRSVRVIGDWIRDVDDIPTGTSVRASGVVRVQGLPLGVQSGGLLV